MKTVSLKLAKELEEKDYPQQSYFYWHKVGDDTQYLLITQESEIIREAFSGRDIAAPTADEILEELPIYFDCDSDNHRYHMRIHPNFNGEKNGKEIKEWIIGYRLMEAFGGKWHEKNPFSDASLADAAAKLWIYLKENDLLEDHAD